MNRKEKIEFLQDLVSGRKALKDALVKDQPLEEMEVYVYTPGIDPDPPPAAPGEVVIEFK